MGEVVRISGESVGYAFSTGWNCVSVGHAKLSPRIISIAAGTNSPTDAPAYFWNATDGTTEFVYASNNDFAWKFSVSANVITLEDEQDFSGGTAGRGDFFLGDYHLPLGATTRFRTLTSIAATGAGADTWRQADASTFAIAFARVDDGPTAKLMRATANSQVSVCSDDPHQLASWGGDWAVGDTTQSITNAINLGPVLAVMRKDGLWIWDPRTGIFAAERVPFSTTVDDNNGTGAAAAQGTETLLLDSASGLKAVVGRSVSSIGPDTIPTNDRIDNVTLEPFSGRHYDGVFASDDWCYSLYRVVEDGTTRTYILAGNIKDRLDNPLWHSFVSMDAACRGLHIDKFKRLWWADSTNNKFHYVQLGAGGQPNAGRDGIGFGATSAAHTLYLPEVMFEPPATLSQLMEMEVRVRGIDADSPIQLQAAVDGAAPANVGTTITAASSSAAPSRRFFTLGGEEDAAPDEGFAVRPVISLTTTASFNPATDEPDLWGVTIRGIPRPERTGRWHIIIDSLSELDGGGMPPPPFVQREMLLALENGTPVKIEVVGGDAITAMITDVIDAGLFKETDDTFSYRIEIRAEEYAVA